MFNVKHLIPCVVDSSSGDDPHVNSRENHDFLNVKNDDDETDLTYLET